MREWTIRPGDPFRFFLAADARMTGTDFFNDHIWELTFGQSEPPAITLSTTFGLRARNLRIFPRFGEPDALFSDPSLFASPITIQRYCPNLIRLGFWPLPDIQAELTYWVTSSHSILGRLLLRHVGQSARRIQVEIAGNLIPGSQGTRLLATEIDSASVLAGQTDGLEPVLYMIGGAQAVNSPFPALAVTVDLPADAHHTLTWALAALPEKTASLDKARQQAKRNFDAEITRAEILDEGKLEIRTGEPDWDHAFDLSQTIAFSLFIGPTQALPHPSFVFCRQPDTGFSLKGDGSDYNYMWNGQSPLETYALFNQILPSSPELAKQIILNFLSVQDSEGSIDWKPGLAGQRSQILASPMLASLTWLYYEYTEDLNFIKDIFQNLLDFFKSWLNPLLDRDNDGIPEWSHPFQTGLEDHPLFSYWFPWSQGRDISTVEGPDLCGFLFRECQILQTMAKLLHRADAVKYLKPYENRFRDRCQTFWDEEQAIYFYHDREGHNCADFEHLETLTGSGTFLLNKTLTAPARLLIHIYPKETATRRAVLFLHGEGPSGTHRVERITTENFRWYPGRGSTTSERLYTTLEQVQIQGLGEKDECALYVSGLKQRNLSLLVPLWARIPSKETARLIIEKTICNPEVFWCNYGLRTYLPDAGQWLENVPNTILIPWNQIICEGMLNYQYRQEAAELFMRIMQAVTNNLRTEGGFRQFYHPDNGLGSGEFNALHGLPPIGLFLKILGVRFISHQKIFLEGFNPFPWPVTVKYRGTTVLRQKEKTTVIFPGGQTISTDRTTPVILTLQ